MIVVAGLSPAWQQVLVVDEFQPGGVTRARGAYWCGSGKALNVAVALHQLTANDTDQSLVLSTLGGPAFDAIESEFAEMGVQRRWVLTQAPTRVCTTIVDRGRQQTSELVENAAPITAAELAEFENAFAENATDATVVVLTGSLPKGCPQDFLQRLLRNVKGRAVLDVRGPELLDALHSHPFLVKPNREELGHTLGTPVQSDAQVQAAMTELQRRGAQAVLVTSGKDDAWLGCDGQFQKFTPVSVVNRVNPIGCGDCLTAGIAWALHRGRTLAEAVEQGLECAGRNLETLIPGDLTGEREQRNRR